MKSREEILQLARECKKDEREQTVRSSAAQLAWGWGIFWAVVIMMIKVAHDLPWTDSSALVSLMAACFDLSRYARLRRQRQLIYGLVWLVVGIVCLWVYVKEI